ncbi:MAG: hypothetical protein ACR2G4_04215 [Pyrinomonadaceae bacterium]
MSPVRLFMLAGLLMTFAVPVTPADCKPKVDKGNIVVELGIPGFNNGKRVVMTMPVKAKETLNGGGGIIPASFNKATSGVSYNLYISEKRKDGAVLELAVNTKARDGADQLTRRTIFIPHNRIIEQQYLNGVQVKTYFKMRPFSCKSV